MLKKSVLEILGQKTIYSESDAYQKGIALEFLNQREQQKNILSSMGIRVLEVEPKSISRTVVEHYLFFKKTGRF